jgi:ribonucleotide monophosphatase NagD (HAD superfamily)
VTALESVTGRTATVIGKPSKLMVKTLLKHEAHRESTKFLMIGDRLDTDIHFGKQNNFQTLLVGTGIHKLEDVHAKIEKIEKGEGAKDAESFIPDYYISALKNLFKN